MLTKKDIDLMKGVFATKGDLSVFATKGDLSVFATKGDLNELREEMNGKLNEMMKNIDWLVREYKKFDEEGVIMSNKVYDDHEKRIGKIESRLGMVV